MDEDEFQRAVLHFLVATHVMDQRGGGEAAVQGAEFGGQAERGDMRDDTFRVLGLAKAQPDGKPEGKAEADGDAFAME